MVTRLTQKYKITCYRCGKEHVREEGVMDDAVFRHITINDEVKFLAIADLCGECYEELCVFVENFFDEVNKENEDEIREKPDAIIITRESNAFFGELYKCPLCGGTFGSFEVDKKDVRCPYCKAELGGIQ